MPRSASGSSPSPVTRVVGRLPSRCASGGVNSQVRAGEAQCLPGRDGTGRPALDKILSRAYEPGAGELLDISPVRPAAAVGHGTATRPTHSTAPSKGSGGCRSPSQDTRTPGTR